MGLMCHTFILSQIRDLVPPGNLAYPTGKVPIKVAKKTDIDKIRQYIPAEYMGFFMRKYYSGQLLEKQ